MITHVLFLRHFKTQSNAERKINGRSLSMPIAETHPIVTDSTIDVVYCSSALRCRQTLDTLLQVHTPGKVLYTDQILERDMGLLEGMPRSVAANQYPSLFQDEKFDVFSTPPGGESYSDFISRVDDFWQQCCGHSTGTVLICSHNQFLKMLSFRIKNEPVTADAWRSPSRSYPLGSIVKVF